MIISHAQHQIKQHPMKQPANLVKQQQETSAGTATFPFPSPSNCPASRRLNLKAPTFACIDALPLVLVLICKDFSKDQHPS